MNTNMVAREKLSKKGKKESEQNPTQTQNVENEKGDETSEMVETKEIVNYIPRANSHGGKVPILPASDNKVDWPMMEIKFKSYLKRFPGLVAALELEVAETEEGIQAQIEAHGQNLDIVYSLIVEMAGENETACLQVRNHAHNDQYDWPNNLWKLIGERFMSESKNRLQNHLNGLGQFEKLDQETFKQFVDRFKTEISNVMSIDGNQLPTEINLMGIIKKAIKKPEPILYAFLEFMPDPKLEEMLSMISKWGIEKNSNSSAVANYSALSNKLKKKHSRSGRGSSKNAVTRAVETRRCLVCDKIGHLVKDCRDSRKEAWIANRRRPKNDKRRNKHEDSDSDRGRPRDRKRSERSDSRGSSRDDSRSRDRSRDRERDRSNSRDRDNRPRKKDKSRAWMDSDGESLNGSDSSESNMLEEFVSGVAMRAVCLVRRRDLVCIDSGSNRLVLIERARINHYHQVAGETLGTASDSATLAIVGRGIIGFCLNVLHCPSASANLISTQTILRCGGKTVIDCDHPEDSSTYFCEIHCRRGNQTKIIFAELHNDLWWITLDEMFDLLLRNGFTEQEDEAHHASAMLTLNITTELEQRRLDQSANSSRVEDDSDFFLELSQLANHHAQQESGRVGQPSCYAMMHDTEAQRREQDDIRYLNSDELPGAKRLREYQERKATGKLRTVAEFEDLPHDELNKILAYRGGQRIPTPVQGPLAAAADAGHDSDASVAMNRVTNSSNIYYSSFSRDLSSCALMTAASKPIAYLGSSTTTDLLTLMHNRTGHGNLRMLIEACKSKLVHGLKIEDRHIRKFVNSDKHVCDVCARAKITRVSFKKVHRIRGNKLGDYISCDIAVFKNCPSREGYLYVVQFLDHGTKFSWVYPMRTRDEFIEKLRDLIDVKLKVFGAKIQHYHADGGAELISKQVLSILKREGARYTWNPAETPELNSSSERRFRTISERTLSMLLRSGLPVDFWWDAYDASNYITNRLPTKTANGYQTPYEGV